MNICQLDGNETIQDSDQDSVSNYDSEDEVDTDPVRVVLVPAPQLAGQTFTLTVDQTGEVAAPSSLPLTMVANLRSAYNKVKNIKRTLHTLGLDFMIVSETWERPRLDLNKLLDSPTYLAMSYCRGRETPATRLDGQHVGKFYPAKTGGGAAIIYNPERFVATDTNIGVPLGIKAKWCIFAPRRLDDRFQRVKRICVGAIYIAPRSPYKEETIEHILHTIHSVRAKYNNEVHFLVAGDFNRVSVTDILLSYGAMQQVCGVATRGGAALQLVLTDLHTYLHPPTALPPLQVDEGMKGKDGDHKSLILAPKASKEFVVTREKREVISRPMPQSLIEAFCKELTRHKWEEVKNYETGDQKTDAFHIYIRNLLDKYFPEKVVKFSALDKFWMTPELKVLLRQIQRERLHNGNSIKYRKIRSKFRRLKRSKVKTFHSKFVEELKTTKPAKWYQMMKRLGGLDQIMRPKLEIESLKGLSDKECAEAVAQSFAAISQEYSPLDRSKLPAFLPAGRPEQVNVFQVISKIRKLGKTKSTLPIDIPDNLRMECAIDLAEPMTDIINTCLRDGSFPTTWRQEWVSPVPKTAPSEPIRTCKDVRKIASCSDYSKIYEGFLRDWIVEDIGNKININQFAGRKGVGTEHMIVMMVDRVQALLDKPGMSAVVFGAVDWKGAFDRQDPTITITKMITMGIRSSIIMIIIEFMMNRKMKVKYNTATSRWYNLVGGSPQGTITGQISYISGSDDNADHVDQDDQYKYMDDLSILELIMMGSILTDYDFHDHVASDIGVDQLYLPPENLKTQQNLNLISTWTDRNLMKLNEEKTNYLIFSRSRTQVATRLTLNGKILERQKFIKLVGVWLQEDGGWGKNTAELCKKAYARVSMLTKLRYAGVSTKDLLHIYKQFVRSKLEFCGVVFHSGLTLKQETSLDRCQAVCLKIILQNEYKSYDEACLLTGISKLSERRLTRCLDFSKKCLKHPLNKRMFPANTNLNLTLEARKREPFRVNFGHTNAYRNSAIPFCQRLLNANLGEEQPEGTGRGHGVGRGEEEGRSRGGG